MKWLDLCFDAPLMSFGTTMIDENGYTSLWPSHSMLAGMFGNALGWTHGDSQRLNRLQTVIHFGCRWDEEPAQSVDFHTVDFSQPYLHHRRAWTSDRGVEERGGGPAKKWGTLIRRRHYIEDGVMTLLVRLIDESTVTFDKLEQALRRPARPLFIGRKACLPTKPILQGIIEAEDTLDALRQVPWRCRSRAKIEKRRTARNSRDFLSALVPAADAYLVEEAGRPDEIQQTTRRDWANQVHVGRDAFCVFRLQLNELATRREERQ